MRTINELIRDAGGAEAVSAATNGQISRDAVYKWPGNGIPDRHWGVIIRLAQSSPSEMYAANCSVRGETLPMAVSSVATVPA